jgi:hypothetical protein
MTLSPRAALLAAALACSPLHPLKAADRSPTASREGDTLLPVQQVEASGQILLTLPPPGPDGTSARLLYMAQLRTGIGSAPLGLDRARPGPARILTIRRMGRKVAFELENPRFRASGAPAAEQAAARDAFATSVLWLGDAIPGPAGSFRVDIAPFLARDVQDIATDLKQDDKSWKLAPDLSVADLAATRAFPDNLEFEAKQTYVSDSPGAEIRNIAPEARQISLTVRHSFIRLPDPTGYTPRRFDPRSGAIMIQAVDFAAPLGREVVQGLATRFRLEKLDPDAPRSRVKKPIVFYIDNAAPEPIRSALLDGARWWAQAFEAAGYIDAYRAEILPEGADPLDIRLNVVNWVNRATRGWSYGYGVTDPRTGEILKGTVLLGSLRVRQDMLIFEGLVGADKVGKGGPNDPAEVALARIRQLSAHEIGHALGLLHNFAGSTQDRASVMDYPAPRVGLVNGAPDLSDAYGVGLGKWDLHAIRWLYGAPTGENPDAAARALADAAEAQGLRFVSDEQARDVGTAHPHGSLWDDGADPVEELERLMEVRKAAVARFGLPALAPGEPVANLRRKFVPIWLMHRYQVEAAAKLLGGLDSRYAVAGRPQPQAEPVAPNAQRAALKSLLATLSPAALDVPEPLVPLLSAGWSGDADRQTDIEIFTSSGGTVFDPLAATDAAAEVTLDALLHPARLDRMADLARRAPAQPAPAELVDALLTQAARAEPDARLAGVQQRIGTRIVIALARAARAPGLDPNVALLIDQKLLDFARTLPARATTDPAERDWALGLSRLLKDRDALTAMLARPDANPRIPPGMPIGSMDLD